MKNPQSQVLKAMIFMALAAFGIQAQISLRCDVTGKDTTGGFKQCLDLTALQPNKTVIGNISIPSNVTRIDNQGFAECTRSDTNSAGIVFIVDQSSSMDLKYAWVNSTKTDTFYYQDSVGCPPGNYPPTATTPAGPNINGTIQIGSQYPLLLKSNTGCQDPSGDPFVIREQAVSNAAAYISSVAPSTVIGYLPFANTVLTTGSTRPLRPVAATAANVAINGPLGINGPNLAPAFIGGTNYDRPMDSAMTWLNSNNPTTGITKTLKPNSIRAIILISDGRTSPADSNGIRFADRTGKVPVYGIFLGKLKTNDTVSLDTLTNLTRPPGVPKDANFYRVPPNRPDSVTGVIRTFLSRIIKVYTPSQVTVTNLSSTPVQNSIATGTAAFGNQGGTGSSWRVQMDSVLALHPNTTNKIRIVSKLKTGAIPPDSLVDTTTFNLNTNDPPGDSKLLIGSLTTKCFQATTLQWLNSAGLRPSSFNETDTSDQIKIVTSKNGLASIVPTLKTIVGPPPVDSLKPSLPRSADSLNYSSPVIIGYGKTPAANGILETKLADTLVASWVHPRDPQDAARDTISIRPANKAAIAYFSTHLNGDTVVTRFDTTTANPNLAPIYLIVRDQRGIPGKPYTVKVNSLLGGTDQATLTLTESVTPPVGAPSLPGYTFFSTSIPVAKATSTNPKNAGNSIIEYVSKGDQLTGQYIDPVNGDVANCGAGINQNAKVISYIQFTDSLGSPIPAGSVIPNEYFWPLTHSRIYLKYQGADSGFTTINAQLSVVSSRLKKTISHDSAQMTMGSKSSVAKGIASWTSSIKLSESLSPVNLDTIVQGAYRIDVIATAPDHDTLGHLTGIIDTAKLVVAWPDSSKSLNFTDTVNATDSLGLTSVILTLNDRNFVHNQSNDTITVTALCNGGAAVDSVSGLRLGESGSDRYVSEPLIRNTSTPSLTDRILSCPSDTGVLIHYFDPVFLGASSSDSLSKSILQAHTPAANPASTAFTNSLGVELTTNDPLVQINYTLDGSLPRPGSSPVYSNAINLSGITNTLKAVGSRPGYLRSRIISEIYLKQPKVLKAYVKDRDRDGQADAVYLVFEKPVLTLPTVIDSLYWNEELSTNRRVSDLDALSSDSLTLSALLNINPFAQYLTGIPSGTAHPPVAAFPYGGFFNGLRVPLADSVGPVPHTALRKPASLAAGSNDTLIITTSEKIKIAGSYAGLVHFVPGGCGDLTSIQNSITVPILGADGVTPEGIPGGDTLFTVLVGNTPGVATPQVGDCIYLDTSGTYTDLNKNKPGLLGVVLTGGASKKIVGAMDGYPPVAGLDPVKNAKAYAVANNSDPTRTHVKTSANYQWVQPFDFASGLVGGKYTPKFDVTGIDDTLTVHSPSDAGVFTSIPAGISTVQVVASTRYIAHVHLTDHMGHFVKSWNQQFGFNGERSNGRRSTDGGSLSYLVWDELDSRGKSVGDGVYIWKVDFDLPNGKKEVYVTRTGLVK